MLNLIEKRSKLLILVLLAASLVAWILYFQATLSPQKTENKQAVKELTKLDMQMVQTETNSFLMNFYKGSPVDQQKLTDITYKYFNPQFLENEFSDRKK